jgi:hypothetical protein
MPEPDPLIDLKKELILANVNLLKLKCPKCKKELVTIDMEGYLNQVVQMTHTRQFDKHYCDFSMFINVDKNTLVIGTAPGALYSKEFKMDDVKDLEKLYSSVGINYGWKEAGLRLQNVVDGNKIITDMRG